MTDTRDYYHDARCDAVEMAVYFADQVAEHLLRDGVASNDLFNDYNGGDSYHHENHVERGYELLDAAELLDQLGDWKEDDYGLWQGIKDPRDAVEVMAQYTYGNAVQALWRDIIEEINEEFKIACDEDKVFQALRDAGEDEAGFMEKWLRCHLDTLRKNLRAEASQQQS
jgi:hypothetical protein